MRLTEIFATVAAVGMVAAPVAASAAPTSSNPAQSLSISNARAGTATAKGEKLSGGTGGIAAAAIGLGIAAIVVLAVIDGTDDDNSDSN